MVQRSYRDEYYPDKSLEKCQDNIDEFYEFMHERHMIWYRRFIKKLPREKWTKNNILKTTKYTNIYRQLDRGTIWYLDNVVKKYKKDYKKDDVNKKKLFKNLLWKTILYRLCNKIETIEEIGLPNYHDFDPEYFVNSWKAIHDRGESIMTSAHLTCPTPKGLKKYEGYMLACFDLYNKIDQLSKMIRKAEDAESVFYLLKNIHSVGGFIAYEVYCDLCYAKAIKFNTNDFVNVGPGAKEGIRLLYPSTTGQYDSEMRLKQLHEDQHKHFKNLGIKFKWYNKYEPIKNELSLRCIEHSLCEYSKYWLQNRGLGKKRMIFYPDCHNSVISDTGEKTIKNINENWEKPKSRICNKVDNALVEYLKQSGLSKEEMKEFILRLRKNG